MKVILRGQSLILRPLQKSFFSEYLQQLSLQVCRLLGLVEPQDELVYLERQLKKGNSFFFCIFTKTNQLIGALEIRDTSYRSQLYNWIHEDFWGNGYYQEALSLALTSYFKERPQEKEVRALVDVTNKRSYYALLKAGFIEKGIIKGPREQQYILVYFV